MIFMAIATKTQFWTSRLNGENPASPSVAAIADNDAWTEVGSAGGGSATTDDYWTITSDQEWKVVPTSSEYTIVGVFYFSDASNIPTNGTVLMSLDNGTHKVEVKSKGTNAKLDLVGATTVTTHDLDLDMGDSDAVPVFLRLTLASDGTANLYMREIIEDDDGATHYLSVTGASGSSKKIGWGNDDGTVKWAAIYATHYGAFSPDELMTSDFAQDALGRMGLATVQQLKDSKRMFLKTHLDDSAIVYGYDISSQMLNRMTPPTIHVLLRSLTSPQFDAIGGGRIIQEYDVIIYVTTRGTNYKDAYRTCLNIAGEVFDELYTNTGVRGNTDSIISYTADLDTKLDDDEVVCVHTLTFRYMRRVNMRHR